MKNFLKTILAAFIGILVFSIVASVIAVIGIAGMAASAASGSTTDIKDGSVLVLKLDGQLTERNNSSSPLSYLSGRDDGSEGLMETLSAIHKAKDNDNIKGIYMEGGELLSDFSQKQEIRDALADFKKSGKWIVAYGDMFGSGTYYLASVADKVYLNPQGMIEWTGLGAQIPLLKNMFAKMGIKFVAFKCGKYKSATEQFTEDGMSEPAKEQETRALNEIWRTMCQAVSKSRGISVDSLNSYADRFILLDNPQNYVKYKMVDGLLYSDQIKQEIKKRLGVDDDDDIRQLTVGDMQGVDDNDSGKTIAVYYASGEIYDEEPSTNMLQNVECIVGNDMVADLDELADDDDVKAVVLRVNSPGGSAYASEKVWHAVEQLKKKKPVVVSMSGTAASGGYYISCGANYIFAEPITVTGSIGIFGLLPDGSGLLREKLGISLENFQTNRNSLFMSEISVMGLLSVISQPPTEEQAAMFQKYIDRGYATFKSRVAQGRNLPMQKVEEIAQGHVYLASDAIKLKLVDELGGIDKAVAKAAQLAKVDKYHAEAYPEEKGFLDQLLDMEDDSKSTYLDSHLRLMLGDLYNPIMMMQSVVDLNVLQARLPFFVSKHK